jgi:hypothetical protein
VADRTDNTVVGTVAHVTSLTHYLVFITEGGETVLVGLQLQAKKRIIFP